MVGELQAADPWPMRSCRIRLELAGGLITGAAPLRTDISGGPPCLVGRASAGHACRLWPRRG
jgi:hypothetical protein